MSSVDHVAADPELVDTIRRVLSSRAPSRHDPTTGKTFDRALWDQLEALGLARLTGAEATGGSGAGWREAAVVLAEAAGHDVALPLAEHDLLAGWLLGRANLPADARLRTVAMLDRFGRARAVPWARHAESVVVVYSSSGTWRVADLSTSAVTITPGLNIAGEPRDDVAVDVAALANTTTTELHETELEELQLRGGLARAIQLVGALERIVTLTCEHVVSRNQFGRPLARFQAVQHMVADLSAESALARATVDAAIRAADDGSRRFGFLTAVARSCGGHATSVVVRNAHQLHGAIGTTLEHKLYRYTLPATAWRSEFGSTSFWDQRVATLSRETGRDGLWSLVAD
ncbi:acyl-CoA dehydrogenase family protein [Nocardia vaccinii]|uniref:acyl-CoA dehydrogenase family protein n=1 Tax=Nocardia vaccinii TaxID=1822 RepID=UPI00082BF4A1|nr:acyl-CoA dehydrogenase family protein [Nocardia vaccinii]